MNINIKNELNEAMKYYDLLDKFINLSLKYFSKNIFENKKDYNITLANILSSWVFSQYQIKYTGFFPIYSNLNLIIDIFKDLSQIKQSSKYLFFELEFKFYYNLIKNKNYISDINIKIFSKKKKINNKLYIIYNCDYLLNIHSNNNELKILKYNYYKLKNYYNGDPKLFDFYIWVILLRYNILGSNNHQLGVSPIIINNLKKDFNLIHELFASPINCTLNSYCSIYIDVEKYFGSVGNFFNYELKSGFYTFNPPYQIDIIEKGFNKLFEYLDKDEKYGFFITVPIWDNEGKSNFNLNEKVIYNDFEIMYKVKKSKYLKLKLEIPKEKFSYLDHNNFNVKNITIQNTYVFILANYDDNFNKIKDYDFFNII
ncbi:phosphorylated CTD interacting factor 1 WW domain protein [Chlorella virus XW01]|nr:phosphorylated CTD interacting factor 1 WW domain protein [Chlorella virus XW01]